MGSENGKVDFTQPTLGGDAGAALLEFQQKVAAEVAAARKQWLQEEIRLLRASFMASLVSSVRQGYLKENDLSTRMDDEAMNTEIAHVALEQANACVDALREYEDARKD